MNRKIIFTLALLALSACGLQVIAPNSSSNPVINQPNTVLYKVSGTATGVVYDPVDVPTGYTVPQSVTVIVDGEDEFIINQNGGFTVPKSYTRGSDYSVELEQETIVLPHSDGITPPIYFTCTVDNGEGTIFNNVDDVLVCCGLFDSALVKATCP